MPTRRVGLFGGAFDPPHRTHVALAQTAITQLQLDVLHVIPTGMAWHKQRPLSDAAHRVGMCQLAFADVPGAVVDPREIQRTGPTFTVETLHELQQQYPGAALYLVIGEDQARALPDWYRIGDIARMATICVAQRADVGSVAGTSEPFQPACATLQYLQFAANKLSSTDIRRTVACGGLVSHLVAEPVARYIDQHHLYQKDQ